MNEQDIIALFEAERALLRGHFVLASGRHSDQYFDKKVLFDDPKSLHALGTAMAVKFMRSPPDVIVAPMANGAKLGESVARELRNFGKHPVDFIAAEKAPGDTFVIAPEFEKRMRGKLVGIVEDVLTTGGSVKKVVEIVRAMGGRIGTLHALVNRGGVTAETVGVPKLQALVTLSVPNWAEEDPCPLCAAKVAVDETVGRGKEYMDKKRAALDMNGC